MTVVSLVVVQVAVQLLLGALSRGGGTISARLEAVAFIVAARALTMVSPGTHTNPAKLEFAQFAVHMVATLVLFDSGIAFGTFFGIGQDPIGGFTFVAAFGGPVGELSAGAWLMGFFPAFAAEHASATASHGADPEPDSDFVTAWRRAILQTFRHFDEIAQHVYFVLLERLWVRRFEEFLKDAARDSLAALVLRTVGLHTGGTLGYLHT